jgi:hypothetical protein
MQDARAPSSREVSYFQEIRRFPILKAEDEYILAMRWRENGEGSAAHQLLTSHLRLVAKIAIAYRGYPTESNALKTWLIDTALFATLGPASSQKSGLRHWLSAHREPVFLSAASLVEIEAAIGRVPASQAATH